MKSAPSRSKKLPGASRKSTSMKSKTDGARLRSVDGDTRPTQEHPEADVKHIVRGLVRKGMMPLSEKSGLDPK